MSMQEAYAADSSLAGKLRRRAARLVHRRPLPKAPDRPLLSISFDDTPLTATTTGAKILESRGVRGTFYVSAGLAGREAPTGLCGRAEDYRRLAEAGHEIACHTFSHLECGRTPTAKLAADSDENAAALASWGAPPMEHFAFPYGDVAPAQKGLLARRFSTLRGLHHGVIEKGCDMNQAPAVGVEGEKGEALARHWLAVAQEKQAWLILFTHDVTPERSAWGCTPDFFAAMIDQALEAGFEIGTVGQIARRLGL